LEKTTSYLATLADEDEEGSAVGRREEMGGRKEEGRRVSSLSASVYSFLSLLSSAPRLKPTPILTNRSSPRVTSLLP